jgi:hypothetical protein
MNFDHKSNLFLVRRFHTIKKLSQFYSDSPRLFCNQLYLVNVLSRAKNSGRQCHFKIWLDCHKLKNFPCLITPMSTKCQKNEKKMTIDVIQHDDRL